MKTDVKLDIVHHNAFGGVERTTANLGRPPVRVQMWTRGEGYDRVVCVEFSGPKCDVKYEDVETFTLDEVEA